MSVKRLLLLLERLLLVLVLVLIVGGDFDSFMPFVDAKVFGLKFGVNVCVVELFNTVYVTFEGDIYFVGGVSCGWCIICCFMSCFGSAFDTVCAVYILLIHTLVYLCTLVDVLVVMLVFGIDFGERTCKAVMVVVNVLVDAVICSFYSELHCGLRGGSFSVKGEMLWLCGIKYIEDMYVSGIGCYVVLTVVIIGELKIDGIEVVVAWMLGDWTLFVKVCGVMVSFLVL